VRREIVERRLSLVTSIARIDTIYRNDSSALPKCLNRNLPRYARSRALSRMTYRIRYDVMILS